MPLPPGAGCFSRKEDPAARTSVLRSAAGEQGRRAPWFTSGRGHARRTDGGVRRTPPGPSAPGSTPAPSCLEQRARQDLAAYDRAVAVARQGPVLTPVVPLPRPSGRGRPQKATASTRSTPTCSPQTSSRGRTPTEPARFGRGLPPDRPADPRGGARRTDARRSRWQLNRLRPASPDPPPAGHHDDRHQPWFRTGPRVDLRHHRLGGPSGSRGRRQDGAGLGHAGHGACRGAGDRLRDARGRRDGP